MTTNDRRPRALRLVRPDTVAPPLDWSPPEMLACTADVYGAGMTGAVVVFLSEQSPAGTSLVTKFAGLEPAEAIALLELAKARLIADMLG